MNSDKSILEELAEQGIHLQRSPLTGSLDISGIYQPFRSSEPMRYEHLQFSLEDLFENLPNSEQRQGAFEMISYLNTYLWKLWFELKFPVNPRTLIKTIDDAYTSMCEHMPSTTNG